MYEKVTQILLIWRFIGEGEMNMYLMPASEENMTLLLPLRDKYMGEVDLTEEEDSRLEDVYNATCLNENLASIEDHPMLCAWAEYLVDPSDLNLTSNTIVMAMGQHL